MRIKCRDCLNEDSGRCSVKRTTVKLNKSRKCNDYGFDQSKELARLERKARVMDNQDRAYKAKLQTLAELQAKAPATEAHPVTGDLSRFTTTAT